MPPPAQLQLLCHYPPRSRHSQDRRYPSPPTRAGPALAFAPAARTARRVPGHAAALARMYNSKHPRWWLQSYLAGVPYLVLGGRDPHGTLVKVRWTKP